MILLALLQEILFNLFGLWPDNYVRTDEVNGQFVQYTDATMMDRWPIHLLGIQLGFLLMALGYLFIERSRKTVPLMVAWTVYLFIQCGQEVFTGNLQKNELASDTVMLLALFGTALLLAKWRPNLFVRWKRPG